MPRFERIVFYYSTGVKPGDEYPCDVDRALKDLGRLASRGIDAKAIDVETLRDLFRPYHKAITGPELEKSSIFGGLRGTDYNEFFGKTTPALLCYTKANDRAPAEVFPRMDRQEHRLILVNEALEKIVEEEGLAQ